MYVARPYHRPVPGSRALWTWGPAVAWAALIFALSSVPDLGTGLGGWDLLLRKLAHAAEYAVLALLLVRATDNRAVALVATVLYAVSDEVHQTFVPGRHGSPVDVAIDSVGAVVGVLVAPGVLRAARRERREGAA